MRRKAKGLISLAAAMSVFAVFATVALVMISSPYSQTFSLPLKNFSCTNARIASTMKNVTAFAIW